MVQLYEDGRMMIKEIEYKNPWFNLGGISPVVYKRMNIKAYPSDCKRGMILDYLPNHRDYIVNGRVVTQRVGKSMSILNQAISYLLDNGPEFVGCDRMKEAYEKRDENHDTREGISW